MKFRQAITLLCFVSSLTACVEGDPNAAPNDFDPQKPSSYFFHELLPELAEGYEVCVIADAKFIFQTATTTDGSFGGVTGGDSICNADANIPRAGTYKALLADGTNRVAEAGAQVDWVMTPDTCYMQTDADTIILKTNANALVDFDGSSYGHKNGFIKTGTQNLYWSGLEGFVTASTPFAAASDNCSSWMSTSGNGHDGYSPGNAQNAWGNAPSSCILSKPLLCVEQ